MFLGFTASRMTFWEMFFPSGCERWFTALFHSCSVSALDSVVPTRPGVKLFWIQILFCARLILQGAIWANQEDQKAGYLPSVPTLSRNSTHRVERYLKYCKIPHCTFLSYSRSWAWRNVAGMWRTFWMLQEAWCDTGKPSDFPPPWESHMPPSIGPSPQHLQIFLHYKNTSLCCMIIFAILVLEFWLDRYNNNNNFDCQPSLPS